MATAVAFDPSASAMRAPLSTADAPSMADSLPTVNFGFEDLRARMASFSSRFDAFIEQGRKRVLEERNQFRINLAELQEDERQKQRDIEILSLKATTHTQTVAKEAQETHEMHQAITQLSNRRSEQETRRSALQAQISAAQAQLAAKRELQAKHARYRDAMARANGPELAFWTDYLCLRIEGAGEDDRLKFVYSHVDDRDWDREAAFVLDMSCREYAVPVCRPKLEQEEVERVLERLNETRELSAFLKGMRELFVEAMK
ncbi:uncharacterized protein K452DRAFT_327822 [Aplosporella prunicola CBS 121167]|uniref:Kinetochore protein SPC25 n=1 Tax=Aplosporella prunicola CBS 121167 TaxID=1176127 RepID=A0A6A6BBM3_9PEZI|nr:uncharacterized protein K452DRAFT_327822 [Aplosporella prunicola CBS 121167]KAF2139881.1 hypothetical protein K452DRAFT_327822 [Aplosporella prunicola CBS 121167]